MAAVNKGGTDRRASHGPGSPTHNSWRGMIKRCTNSTNASWKYYGARGVKVCDRWRGPAGFDNFLADMGEKPEGTSIDRIDGDGDYTPDNCRWATFQAQAQTRRPPEKGWPTHTRLTAAEVEQIRILPGSNSDLGKRFGVNASTISRIRSGKRWAA